jgi:hypothetical protein
MGIVIGCSGPVGKGGTGTDTPSAADTRSGAKVKTVREALDMVFRQASFKEELELFPRTVGTKQGVLVPARPAYGGKDLVGSFETAAAPGENDPYQVTLTRRWELDGRQYSTVWRFRVQPDGTVTELGRTGDNLPEF